MNALDISASALAAQRVRMTAVAANLANAHTTRDEFGRPNPYRRVEVLFGEGLPGGGGAGVHVAQVQEDPDPFQWTYDPQHPDSIRDPGNERFGYVQMPRINPVTEMVDMMLASRSYEANLGAIEATKAMQGAALRIIA